MEIAQRPFENVILDKLRSPKVSVHWCNTFWAEWIYISVQRVGQVIEQSAAIFHPAYETEEDTSNQFCESKSFTVANTNVLKISSI